MKVYHNLTRMTLNMGYITTKMASLAGAFISSIMSDPSDCKYVRTSHQRGSCASLPPAGCAAHVVGEAPASQCAWARRAADVSAPRMAVLDIREKHAVSGKRRRAPKRAQPAMKGAHPTRA